MSVLEKRKTEQMRKTRGRWLCSYNVKTTPKTLITSAKRKENFYNVHKSAVSEIIVHENVHWNQRWCLDSSQAGQCLSISFYLWPNIMLLGNSQLYQSYQISISSSVSGRNVYVWCHLFSSAASKRNTKKCSRGRCRSYCWNCLTSVTQKPHKRQ